MTSRFSPTSLLAAVLVVIATAVSPALADDHEPRRTISLSGIGQVQARPDTARINAGVLTDGADAGSALAANSKAMNSLFRTLKQAGIADRDMQTSNFSISPRYAPYNRQNPESRNRIIGYRVSNQMAVRVRDLTDLGRLIDAMAGAGANRINGISFYVDKSDNLMDEARKRAIADARRKAELYATEAGTKLKRILTIREGGGVPGPRPVFRAMAAADKAESVPVAAGEQTLRASVSVTYELE